jgi:predicted dehydrogenase
MSQRPIKVAFLGSGMIATFSYGYLVGTPYVTDKIDVVAVCDPLVSRARAVAAEYRIPHVYESIDDLLATSDAELVVNLTPIPLHGETSLKILRSGRHLVTEKPIASTVEDATALIETAKERGLTLVCAPPELLDPTIAEVTRLVAAGAIGQTAFARVRSSHEGPAGRNWPNDPTWFYQTGSGPLLDMGVYGIHQITGILGPAKRVVGFSGITEPVRTVRGGPFDGKKITVTADDNTLLMLDFGGSTFAVVDGTFNVHAAKSPRLELFGRAGTITIPDSYYPTPNAPFYELFRLDAFDGVDGWISARSSTLAAAHRRFEQLQRTAVIDHAVNCIRAKQHPLLSGEHARHALEIMLKAIESARTGQTLDLTTSF